MSALTKSTKPRLTKYQNDLTGTVFGTLTVVAYEGQTPRKNSLWTCICSCGGYRRGVAYQSLMQNLTNRCLQCGYGQDTGRKAGLSKKNHNNQHTAGRKQKKPKDWI